MGYAAVLEQYRRLMVLGSIKGVLFWDREVVMPEGATGLRDEQEVELEALIHQEATNPILLLKLDEVDRSELSALEVRQLDLITKDLALRTALPPKFAEHFTRTQIRCYNDFKIAKECGEFATVRESFANFVAALRERVAFYRESDRLHSRYSSKSDYDIMIDAEFDPGLSDAKIQELFNPLKKFLLANREGIQSRRRERQKLTWPPDRQMAVAAELVRRIGFDASRGRLDQTRVHPFCGGGFGDTRITTKVNEDDALDALLSAMHEVGHGIYDQNLPAKYRFSPLGLAPSMGIHESQSRFVENQICRSRYFVKLLSKLSGEPKESLDLAVRGKASGYIRVDADEIDYNLHIILRWEIERELASGSLDVGDVPEAWNSKFQSYFGKCVPNHRLGCLQDIHWYGIGFGYFPSYTIGNIFAAQLFAAFQLEHPDWGQRVEGGDLLFINQWLKLRVHDRGAEKDTIGTVQSALGGQSLAVEPLIEYLNQRGSDLTTSTDV